MAVLVDDGRVGSVAPERSLQQRLDALAKANRVRLHHARVKRELKSGALGFVDVLEDSGSGSMRLLDVLMALPKYRRVKATRLLTACRISPSKTVGGLTRRQQNELVALLGERAWPSR